MISMSRIYDWKPNRPIRELIREFEDKQSGRVSTARKEIFRRFDGLDWKDQKRILHICLDSCATDRQWAYGKLWRMWDKSFEEKVRKLWEETHEYKSQWPVTRHFPADYLIHHIEDFSDRDYFFICLRLVVEVPDYKIDKERLSPLQYLKVLSRGGYLLDDAEEAWDLLYQTIADMCVGSCLEFFNNSISSDIPDELYYVKSYVRNLGQEEVADEFENWFAKIWKEIQEALKQKDFLMEQNGLPKFWPMRTRSDVIIGILSNEVEGKYTAAALEKRKVQEEKLNKELELIESHKLPELATEEEETTSAYKHYRPITPAEYYTTRREMVNRNHAIQMLIDEMDLEPTDEPPF